MTRRRTRRAATTTIVDICRRRDAIVLDEPGIAGELALAAQHHRVAPLVYIALRETNSGAVASLKPDRDSAIAVHVAATVVLDMIAELLEELPWLVFKGPVLSEHAHPVVGVRTFQDVDVLVDPTDLREVTRRLNTAGWTVADFDHMLRLDDTAGEMHWISPTGLVVDLHWSMINMAVRRRRFSVSTADLLARRVRVPLGLTHTWTLDNADTLVHVCLHAAQTGAHRLLLLLDADTLARQVDDWAEVARRAREWRAEASVSLVLHRASRVLGTPLPHALDRMLGVSPAFGLITASTDRLAPIAGLRRDASIAKLVARAVRPGVVPTVASILHSVTRGLRDRAAGASDETPARRPAEKDAIEAYLRAVEAEAD